jgi:tetratricopeptide (TPR) repeat protein
MSFPTPRDRRRLRGVRQTLAALYLLFNVASAFAQGPTTIPGLGSITFPVSTRVRAAQQAFARGVLLLHLFEYPDAAYAFREAERLDPDLAMAYWGEAMTHAHPIWNEEDPDAARAVLAKLGPTAEAREAKAPTARERGYLAAVNALYGPGSQAKRDTQYVAAMEHLVTAYPADDEARLFYALALLGLSEGVRDESTYMRAAAIAESVFTRDPDNPGAAHYLIHAVDDPRHAARGLPAAQALARSSPRADHAQHMTSHIFVALGMWDEVVQANERAARIMNGMLDRLHRAPLYCRHYNVWLDYGYVEQGRLTAAAQLLERCRAQAANARDSSQSAALDQQSFLSMWSNYLFAGNWADSIAQWTMDPGPTLGARLTYEFTQTFGAARRGDVAAARKGLAAFAQTQQEVETWFAGSDDPAGDRQELSRARVMRAELDGLIAGAERRVPEELALLRRATLVEDSMPYAFGPPFVNEPSHELLGAELLRLERFAEAEAEFQTALERNPRRTVALQGLARAAAGANDAAVSAKATAGLASIWSHADPEFLRAHEHAN